MILEESRLKQTMISQKTDCAGYHDHSPLRRPNQRLQFEKNPDQNTKKHTDQKQIRKTHKSVNRPKSVKTDRLSSTGGPIF